MTSAGLLTNVPVLIIDLEATCDVDPIEREMEIIEIGAVWVTSNGTVLGTFQALVRPISHPQLTPFCQQLTGIQQTDVDYAEQLPVVAALLDSFAKLHQAPGATWPF